MPSELVIRRSVLLLSAALAAGMLMSGGQVRAEDSTPTNGLGELIPPQPSEGSTPFVQTHSDGLGDNSAVAALSPSWVQPITTSITPREQLGSTAVAGSRQSDSAAVPLPPAAWTGLSSLLGLGAISFARNLRRTMK